MFLESIYNDFNKFDSEKREIIILGDFNINLLQNKKYVFDNNISSQTDESALHRLLKQYKRLGCMIKKKDYKKKDVKKGRGKKYLLTSKKKVEKARKRCGPT